MSADAHTPDQDLIERARAIKLLVLDVDGVLTDGRLFISEQGEQVKVFSTLDGLGIKMLQASGVIVAIISGRASKVLEKRAAELRIKHLYQGREDKLAALEELLIALNLTLEQTAHLGDDLPDLPVIKRVGLGMAVASAYPFVKQHAHWCTDKAGGAGAAREACDFIMTAQDTLDSALKAYL